MYSNQQTHSSSGNYQQHPNSLGHSSYPSSPLRQPTSYPRSSSVSSAVAYQQTTLPEFDHANGQQHPPYNPSSMYSSDIQSHPYATSPQTPGAPFQLPAQRSANGTANYPVGQHELNGPTAFRRVVQSMHSGPTRARAMSLSYEQPAISSRSSSAEYAQQKYAHDSRYSPQTSPYPPPSAYRAGATSPPIASRPIPGRMNSLPAPQDTHQRRSPLTIQPPAHVTPRRDSSASSSSQSYQPRAVTIEPAGGSSSNSATPPAAQPRPHVCEMCGLAFVRGHDLKRHKDTHNNSKPHVCECGKSFSRKDALKRHVYLKSCRGEKMGGYATSEE